MFDSRLIRNPKLKTTEFSVSHKLLGTDGKYYNTRLFNEDGIYEITLLSESKKGEEFRSWVRKILKSLRKGESKILSMTEYQKLMMSTRTENTKIRKAQLLTKLADQYDGTFKQVLQSYATKELTGEHLIPLPTLKEKTYSATEIGEMFGVSANRVGIISNKNGMKVEEYGQWFNDKARGHNKEIKSFRYYESALPVFENLLKSITA